jgi:hypothetical protein
MMVWCVLVILCVSLVGCFVGCFVAGGRWLLILVFVVWVLDDLGDFLEDGFVDFVEEFWV